MRGIIRFIRGAGRQLPKPEVSMEREKVSLPTQQFPTATEVGEEPAKKLETKKKKFGENYIETLESTESGKDIAKTLKEKKTKILPMTDEVRKKYGKSKKTLNMRIGNKVYIDPSYSDEVGAAHLAHEGQHIKDGKKPNNLDQTTYDREKRAFESEAKVWKELKEKDPSLKDSYLDSLVKDYDSGDLPEKRVIKPYKLDPTKIIK